MKKIVAIDASPNTDFNDALTSLKILLSPWSWYKNEPIDNLKKYFTSFFNTKYAFPFESGRSALQQLLSAIVSPGDEVITQAFTCLVVPQAIIKAGGKPVFIDIDPQTYNLNPDLLESLITPRTKAVIIQNTFGIPPKLDLISKICQKHSLILIEDCAHVVGAEYNNKLAGTFGETAIFSFSQDKVFASVKGGLCITNNSKIAGILKKTEENLVKPNRKEIARQLLHPLVWTVALPTYEIFIGKIIVFLAWQMGILNHAVTTQSHNSSLPAPQAQLVLNSLKHFEKDSLRRNEIAALYKKELSHLPIQHPQPPSKSSPVYLRYPIQVESAEKVLKIARQNSIILGRWYHEPIMPWTELGKTFYKKGSCPKAENAGKHVINLPTYPRMNEENVSRVVKTVKEAYE